MCASRELVEAHEVLKVAQLASMPLLLQRAEQLAESSAVLLAVAVAVLEGTPLLDLLAHVVARPLRAHVKHERRARIVKELKR